MSASPDARTSMRSPGRPKMLSTSAGSVAGAAEPVRHLGVELGRLADAEDQILVAQHEPHPPGQDVEPLEPVVRARRSARTESWG